MAFLAVVGSGVVVVVVVDLMTSSAFKNCDSLSLSGLNEGMLVVDVAGIRENAGTGG